MRWEFVGLDDQKLPLSKTLGDALRDLVRRRWKHHTAKTMERQWGLDPKTAKNVVAGHVSERTLTKALWSERWSLWMALGEEVMGESYQAELQRMVDEAANVTRLHEEHRATVASLEERAAAAGLSDRPTLRQVR